MNPEIKLTCGRCYGEMLHTQADENNEGQPTHEYTCSNCQKTVIVTEVEQMPVTLCRIADARLGRKAETWDDFQQAGIPIAGGCERCAASIAAYNAYPSRSGFIRCEDCIGNLGFKTVAEFEEWANTQDERGHYDRHYS